MKHLCMFPRRNVLVAMLWNTFIYKYGSKAQPLQLDGSLYSQLTPPWKQMHGCHLLYLSSK